MGGSRETLMGLAGLGDLVLTCTGDLSRNRRVGLALAEGKALPAILAELGHVAEGVPRGARRARAGRASRHRHAHLRSRRPRAARGAFAAGRGAGIAPARTAAGSAIDGGSPRRRLALSDEFDQRRAVALELRCAPMPLMPPSAREVARPLARDLGQRAVVQDHVGRHRLRARLREPPRLQPLEQRGVGVRQVAAAARARLRARRAGAATARRIATRCSPRSTGRLASVSRSAPCASWSTRAKPSATSCRKTPRHVASSRSAPTPNTASLS